MQPIANYKTHITKGEWSKADVETALRLSDEGVPYRKIARELNRTYAAVHKRLYITRRGL